LPHIQLINSYGLLKATYYKLLYSTQVGFANINLVSINVADSDPYHFLKLAADLNFRMMQKKE